MKMHSQKKMEQSLEESQNFFLRLSQDSTISDSQDRNINNENDVIVISDSSPTCSSIKRSVKSKSNIKKHFTNNDEVYIIDSDNSDSSNKEEEKFFQLWKAYKKQNFINRDEKYKTIAHRSNTLCTSDETSSNSSVQSKGYISNSNKTSSSYINTTLERNNRDVHKTTIQLSTKTAVEKNVSSSCATSSTTSSKSSKKLNPLIKNDNNSDVKKKLTKKVAASIMNNIKATRLVYESPRRQRENNEIMNNNIDDNMHPAISHNDNLRINYQIINETPVDSESEIVQDSQTNVINLYKTHISRFLDPPDVEKAVEIGSPELSERKKKQISQWLMTTSPESKSDSSSNNVPATIGDGISSGNSSLERLEMVYETPNNRGKVNHVPVSEKRVTVQDSDKIIHSTVPRQTTIHDYVQKSKKNDLELRTPKNNRTGNNVISTPTTNAPQNVDIADCADILDKLYGRCWREKADKLLPTSEPRNQMIPKRNRAVQTERKPKTKVNVYLTDSEGDDSNTSFDNLKLQKYVTKKNTRKDTKQRDSFINDRTSSESGCESSYYTALTNPRTSTNSVQCEPKPTPIVQRLVAICDTDSEDEENGTDNFQTCDTTKKRLLFTDDESEHSSTSEFDPGDNVPPKPIIRKNNTKTPRPGHIVNPRTESTLNNRNYEKHSSFLASLSESVPLSNVHPDAKIYRANFKSNKENLCNHLFKLYNEKVFDKKLPEDMSIEWNIRMRGTAGFCYNKKSLKALGGVAKSSRIVLATKVLDTPDRLRDTLIHEMCHAAAWLINDVSDGHGPFWTGWAKKAMQAFPDLPPIRRCHDYKIKTKFTYKCVGCGYSIGRHSKSLDTERKRCGHCYGKFELLINKTTKSGTVQVQTPKRQPSGFALYVKENYNTVKKERNIRHGEVMKILGQLFSATKIAKQTDNFETDTNAPG